MSRRRDRGLYDGHVTKREEGFDEVELERLEREGPIRPPVIFEAIRRQGEEEMVRPVSALALSGLVAGFALGFSVLTQAVLRAHLPDTEWRLLIEGLGYTIGFLIVILGQMQLFTESTITAVCPALDSPSAYAWLCLLRLWSVVLVTNVCGGTLFAASIVHLAPVSSEVWLAYLEISRHAASFDFWQTVIRGAGAGWLMATLVWVMPNAESGKPIMIVLMTYLITIAEFSHVVAGSGEAAALVLAGLASVEEVGLYFILPAFLGNVLGGAALFTLLTWAQIRAELPDRRD